MRMKKNIYLAQIPFQYNSNHNTVYFPYSVGLLWSFAKSFADIDDHYVLKEIIFLKEDITDVVSRMVNPSVVGLSCYMWNMNYNMQMATQIKQKFPNCVIVAGGPGVSVTDEDFFDRYPSLDVLIYREGEIAFKDLLLSQVHEKTLDHIPGIAFKQGYRLVRTVGAQRVENLDQVPSPYLTGLFDGMSDHARQHGITVNGILETNRGCPFSCTFCDWGNGTLGKVKKFDLRRVKKELLWMAKQRVEFVSNCDANFGIYKERDMAICKFMTRLKKRYGFPKLFDTNWHKNNNSSTVEMAKHLMDHGMLRRFTSSIQSQNQLTLKAIKRRNLSDKNISDIVDHASNQGISTLTELIIGLPDETYQSFQRTYVNCINKGIVPTASPLIILPNSEMNEPTYRQRYGFVTKKIKKKFTYVDEEEEIVIGTNTMTTSQYERLVLWCWFVQQFHFHGYTNVIFDFVRRFHNLDFATFYEKLLDLLVIDSDQVPNRLLSPLKNHVSTGRSGVLTFGTINYDFHEEIGYANRTEFYDGLQKAVSTLITETPALIDDLIILQNCNQINFAREQIEMFETSSNLWDVLEHGKDLEMISSRYWVKQDHVDKSNYRNFGEFIVNTRTGQKWRTVIQTYEPHLS